ncbi:MAG: FeoC-like transcriptional regulator [Arthrospira sp. SH-MAG29]|nr:FeoC-like transcriptional regulator [Arthrospira sp. SH-MAG29]
MLLQQLQNHLRNHGRVSLAELEHQMKIDAETLRLMLGKLIRKGRVCKVEGKACGGCHSCPPEAIEFYEWISPQSMS